MSAKLVKSRPEEIAVRVVDLWERYRNRAVTFQLPTGIEEQLRRELSDLNEVAKEAAMVELYRLGKLSHHELATALGLERFETDGLLKRHNVTEDLGTPDEFAEEAAALHCAAIPLEFTL